MSKKKEVCELWKMRTGTILKIISASNMEEAIDIFICFSGSNPQHIDYIGTETEAPNIFS